MALESGFARIASTTIAPRHAKSSPAPAASPACRRISLAGRLRVASRTPVTSRHGRSVGSEATGCRPASRMISRVLGLRLRSVSVRILTWVVRVAESRSPLSRVPGFRAALPSASPQCRPRTCGSGVAARSRAASFRAWRRPGVGAVMRHPARIRTAGALDAFAGTCHLPSPVRSIQHWRTLVAHEHDGARVVRLPVVESGRTSSAGLLFLIARQIRAVAIRLGPRFCKPNVQSQSGRRARSRLNPSTRYLDFDGCAMNITAHSGLTRPPVANRS